MHRSELYRVLHDRATAGGVSIHYGRQLIDVQELPTGVTARSHVPRWTPSPAR